MFVIITEELIEKPVNNIKKYHNYKKNCKSFKNFNKNIFHD